MTRKDLLPFALLLALAVALPAAGQTSAHYKSTEWTLNGGGDPNQGSYAASANFGITFDAMGEAAVAPATLKSASYRMEGDFARSYPPPGEVEQLTIDSDKRTLHWDAEKSVGTYNVYRGLLTTLPGTFGTCFDRRVATNLTTDAAVPPPRDGYFYLVTARNRLEEEGPKGYQSSGALEPNPSPCP